jgi:hypothetical protein
VYQSERFFVLTVHPRSGWGSGTPGRAQVLDQMIGYMKAQPGVRFFSSTQMAQWCLSQVSALEEVSFA